MHWELAWGLADWVWHLESWLGTWRSHLISTWQCKNRAGAVFSSSVWPGLIVAELPWCLKMSLTYRSKGRVQISPCFHQLQLTVLLQCLPECCGCTHDTCIMSLQTKPCGSHSVLVDIWSFLHHPSPLKWQHVSFQGIPRETGSWLH